MKRYPIWSYLSISAMDAPLISIAWYLYFAQNLLNISLNIQHCLILGVSVWLGYMADRLFDIRFKKEAQLISLRHQFCKEKGDRSLQKIPYLWRKFMRCPFCGNEDTQVRDSRPTEEASSIRRRRQCLRCTWKITFSSVHRCYIEVGGR